MRITHPTVIARRSVAIWRSDVDDIHPGKKPSVKYGFQPPPDNLRKWDTPLFFPLLKRRYFTNLTVQHAYQSEGF
jgi:hypothetical protein